MIKTVNPLPRARKTASSLWAPSALKPSSGPYDEEESPSAPSPTQASKATSDTWWNTPGSVTLRGRPTSQRRTRRRSRGSSTGVGIGVGSGGSFTGGRSRGSRAGADAVQCRWAKHPESGAFGPHAPPLGGHRSASLPPSTALRLWIASQRDLRQTPLGEGLRRANASVTTFESSEAVEAALAGDLPDALLLDQALPEALGLVRRLREG